MLAESRLGQVRRHEPAVSRDLTEWERGCVREDDVDRYRAPAAIRRAWRRRSPRSRGPAHEGCDVDPPAAAAASASRDPGRCRPRGRWCRASPGRARSGLPRRSPARAAAGGAASAGRARPVAISAPLLTRTWPSSSPHAACAFSTTGTSVAGRTRPTARPSRAGLRDAGHEVAGRGRQPAIRGCRRRGPRARRRRSGARTPHRAGTAPAAAHRGSVRRSPGAGMPRARGAGRSNHRRRQPRRSAVSSPAYCRAARRVCGKPVAAADARPPSERPGGPPAHRSMSRW